MGCGCSSGSSSSSVQRHSSTSSPQIDNSDCPYNIDLINEWISRFYCAKEKGAYISLNISKRQINLYEGILLSARNYSDNICYFRTKLQQVENFMTVLTAQGIC